MLGLRPKIKGVKGIEGWGPCPGGQTLVKPLRGALPRTLPPFEKGGRKLCAKLRFA